MPGVAFPVVKTKMIFVVVSIFWRLPKTLQHDLPWRQLYLPFVLIFPHFHGQSNHGQSTCTCHMSQVTLNNTEGAKASPTHMVGHGMPHTCTCTGTLVDDEWLCLPVVLD